MYLSSRASAGNLSDVLQAQSFQIDSKFGPVACPEIGKSGTDCVFGDETLPLIFQVSPDDLDHVEFGVVGSQVEQECSIIDQPIFSSRFAGSLMGAGIVQDDRGRLPLSGGEQVVNKSRHVRTFDGVDIGRGSVCSFRSRTHRARCVDTVDSVRSLEASLAVTRSVEQRAIRRSRRWRAVPHQQEHRCARADVAMAMIHTQLFQGQLFHSGQR
ncbi:hypothetical protein [Paraburkholderia solitsugae]|nr:hypothetical protein [Paraburkholderia solitsugae]